MERIFTSKNIIIKVALVLVIILLIEFTINCKPVRAVTGEGIGGLLLAPVMKLIVSLADGIMDILQINLLGMNGSFTSIPLDDTAWSWIKKIAFAALGLGLIVLGLSVALIPIMMGATMAIVTFTTSVGAVVASLGAETLATTAIVYKFTGKTLGEAAFGNTFTLASIAITPESILANEIPLFNVNFFSTRDLKDYEIVSTPELRTVNKEVTAKTAIDNYIEQKLYNSYDKISTTILLIQEVDGIHHYLLQLMEM